MCIGTHKLLTMTSHALFYHEIYKLSDLAKLYRIADRISHPRWKDRSKDQEFYLKTKKTIGACSMSGFDGNTFV